MKFLEHWYLVCLLLYSAFLNYTTVSRTCWKSLKGNANEWLWWPKHLLCCKSPSLIRHDSTALGAAKNSPTEFDLYFQLAKPSYLCLIIPFRSSFSPPISNHLHRRHGQIAELDTYLPTYLFFRPEDTCFSFVEPSILSLPVLPLC